MSHKDTFPRQDTLGGVRGGSRRGGLTCWLVCRKARQHLTPRI